MNGNHNDKDNWHQYSLFQNIQRRPFTLKIFQIYYCIHFIQTFLGFNFIMKSLDMQMLLISKSHCIGRASLTFHFPIWWTSLILVMLMMYSRFVHTLDLLSWRTKLAKNLTSLLKEFSWFLTKAGYTCSAPHRRDVAFEMFVYLQVTYSSEKGLNSIE